MLIRTAILSLAGTFFAGISLFGQVVGPVSPIASTFTSTSNLPPIGFGSTETAQVILTNTATSCTGSIAFYNAAGSLIGTATSFTLGAGHVSAVSLPYASTGAATPRALVRAVVSLTTTFPSTSPCSLSYSLAIFDTVSGVTHAIVPGSAVSPIAIPVLGKL